MADVRTKDIDELLYLFEKTTYRARENNPKLEDVLNKCHELFKLDYKCMVIPNPDGELCNSYPSRLIIPECEKTPGDVLSDNESAPCPLSLQIPSPLTFPPMFPSQLPSTASAPSFSSVVASLPHVTVEKSSSTTSICPAMQRKGSLPGGDCQLTATIDGIESQTDGTRLRDVILKAKCARCRARFPVPSILYKGNYICRSSTLSGGPEMYGRSGIEYFFASAGASFSRKEEDDDEDDQVQQTSSDWQLFDRVRSQDIRLLKACNVATIVDLMVEKKKVKFGMYVTSSEKVDKENRYSDFTILSLPYPGCEFFRDFRDLNYSGEGLYFDWNQAFVDAQLVIPERSLSAKVTSDWNSYRKWDLVRLTQNYLKLLLMYAQERSGGLLVHCISGWDRTPLFISLLRLSLWADGLVHASLDHAQILYLTIAYDWMLFGHDLKDRLAKGEEIFFFCFYFLKFMSAEKFAIGRKRHHSSDSLEHLSSAECTVLLESGETLSSAGSSNSLNSSCSSNRSSHAPPVFFKSCRGDAEAVHLTWPYGSFNGGDLTFDDLSSPALSRTSSVSSTTRRSLGGRVSSRPDSGDSCSDDSDWRGGNGSSRNGKLSSGCNAQSITSKPRNGHSTSSGESAGSESIPDICCSNHPPDQLDGPSSGSPLSVPPGPGQISTSPVAVPVPKSRTAAGKRHESVGSAGSWQMISGTGSLRGSTSSRGSRASCSNDMVDSATTIKEEGSVGSETSILVFNREDRLAKVRSLFYSSFCAAIGFKLTNGRTEPSGLGTLVSNFAQKVGIKPTFHNPC